MQFSFINLYTCNFVEISDKSRRKDFFLNAIASPWNIEGGFWENEGFKLITLQSFFAKT